MELLGPLIFFLIGVFFAILFPFIGISTGEIMFLAIGGGIGTVFAIIGVFWLKVELKARNERKEIVRLGDRVTAVIIDYRNGEGTVVNGKSPVDLVVECEYMGGPRQFTVPTGKYSEVEFPIGAITDIAILGVKAAIVEGTVRFAPMNNTYNNNFNNNYGSPYNNSNDW